MNWSLSPLAARVLIRRRSCRPIRKSARPRVEALEDRLAPATIDVMNIADSGVGSLRWAVEQANLPGEDTIVFDSGMFVPGTTILLTSGQISLTDTTAPTTIEGLGTYFVNISGNHASRIFSVGSGVTATISGVTITAGKAGYPGSDYYIGCGGGIYNEGNLTASGTTLSGNSAINEGGAIYNAVGSNLTVSGSILYGNSATFGGGIGNRGVLTVSGSSLSGNSAVQLSGMGSPAGGGISNAAGTLTVSGSILSHNTTTGNGGAINNTNVLAVSASTLSYNSAVAGGGIYTLYGTGTVSPSTLSGNSASDTGGGIYNNWGGLTVSQSTLSGNSANHTGGGIATLGPTNSTLYNTLVAGNLAGTSPSDMSGTFVAGSSYNLIGDGSGGLNPSLGNLLGTPTNLLEPLLGPLANNGGLTSTMGLLAGSPAINMGDPAILPAANSYDQRGPGYERVVGGRIDIGAFEVQTLSATAQLAVLTEHVQDLASEGVLKAGVWRSLTAKLQAVAASLERDNTTAAVNHLEAFIKQVEGLRKAGKLTGEAAQLLTIVAERAMDLATVPTIITVTNTYDSGVGSLRWAVEQANLPGEDKIVFDANVFATPRTIVLTSGQLRLTDQAAPTTIEGPGAERVTISGNNASRIFWVESLVTATISGLSITKGHADSGGGIYTNYAGTLTLTDCTVANNFANLDGGGLYNPGTSIIIGCTITDNVAGRFGGGIYTYGSLTVTGSAISGNTADSGGGVYNYAYGSATFSQSTISGNSVGSEFSYGGGIYNSGSLTVTGSTISGNFADSSSGVSLVYGGGIYSMGSLTVTLSTISGNSAAGDSYPLGRGGGIYSESILTVSQSTIFGNSADYGGGIHSYTNYPGFATTALFYSLVAGNHAGGSPSDLYGTGFNTGSPYNLIGDGSGGFSASLGNLLGTLTNPLDPKLGPLADNGGPTWTHALLAGSPAINKGDPAILPAPLSYDQRGPGYERVVDGRIDIGAFEVQTLTATGQLAVLTDHVQALASEGVLTAGVWRSLAAKLETTIASLERGNTTAAVHHVEAFIKQVEGLRKAGKLTGEAAQLLTIAAERVMDLIAAWDVVFADMTQQSASLAGNP